MKENTPSQQGVPGKDILSPVRGKGMFAKQFCLDSTTPDGRCDKPLEMVGAHLECQVDLERRGIMFAAGPNWTEDEREWRGDGTVVTRAASMHEAQDHAGGPDAFEQRAPLPQTPLADRRRPHRDRAGLFDRQIPHGLIRPPLHPGERMR